MGGHADSFVQGQDIRWWCRGRGRCWCHSFLVFVVTVVDAVVIIIIIMIIILPEMISFAPEFGQLRKGTYQFHRPIKFVIRQSQTETWGCGISNALALFLGKLRAHGDNNEGMIDFTKMWRIGLCCWWWWFSWIINNTNDPAFQQKERSGCWSSSIDIADMNKSCRK